jgi:hypothetical protein
MHPLLPCITPSDDIKKTQFELCYTSFMQPPSYWKNWAEKLERWGLTDLAAALLESSGPVSTILAQLVYAGSPFLPGSQSESWGHLAHLFENPSESRAFAHFLKEGCSK